MFTNIWLRFIVEARTTVRSNILKVFILELIQRFTEYPIYKRKRVSAFIIDETAIQIGR
jgi:hypothetical protein